jgi:predicted metal-dependent phosphoesterase TrpH
MDWRAGWFEDFLREQRAERTARVHRIVERLTELGMPLTAAEVFAICKEGSPGRPHVAQAMVERGYAKSVREAFDRWLHADGPASVPRRRLTPVEAVAVIRRAGGVPVFAHPGLAGRDEMIPELVEAGLAGIETYYPEHSAGQIQMYRDLCRRLGLVATGGSDYHGLHTGRATTVGTPHVGIEVWHELRAKAHELRNHIPRSDPRAPELEQRAIDPGESDAPPSTTGHPRR